MSDRQSKFAQVVFKVAACIGAGLAMYLLALFRGTNIEGKPRGDASHEAVLVAVAFTLIFVALAFLPKRNRIE